MHTNHLGVCSHDYNIVRVVNKVPKSLQGDGPECYLVLGSDNEFHVVSYKCIPLDMPPEFKYTGEK